MKGIAGWKIAVLTVIVIALLISILPLVFAAGREYPFVKNASAAPLNATDYDYIIVGGGTAGCPLAATLSLNYSVLLLERGNTPYGNPDIENAAGFGQLISNIHGDTWFSPVQSFQSQDGVFNRRARVLGGGTAINAGFYSRASDDYVRKAGWDTDMVASAYAWVEDAVAFFPRLQHWQSAFRDALLEVGIGPDNGNSYEHVKGTKVGGSIFDEAGKRHTAADLLQHANQDNITVLLFANVHRILFAPAGPIVNSFSSNDGTPGQFFNSTFKVLLINVWISSPWQRQEPAQSNWDRVLRQPRDSASGIPSSRLKERGSGGCWGSWKPTLADVKRGGDAAILKSHDIPVVLNLSGVGKGMADNPANVIYVPSPIPVETSLVQTVGITDFGGFIEAASGAPASMSQVAALSTVAPGLRNEALMLLYAEEIQNLPKETQRILGQAGVILQKVDGPVSSGSLSLNEINIEDSPLVRFNYFSAPEDLFTCIETARVVRQILNTETMRNFTYTSLIPDAIRQNSQMIGNFMSDNLDVTTLTEWCRNTVTTIWHYHGGCQVGSVVDNEYRVIGAAGLRVIDGSTFDSSPGTNPQATVMMLGRYMGLKMHQDRQ